MGTIKDIKSLSIYLIVLSLAALQTNSQRVVPGVNPQHYQQVPVQQQYQHSPPPAPQQYQQPHHQQHAPGVNPQQYQQQQQMPQAQYQQQVPVHQQPPQQQHQQQQMHQQVPQGHVPQQQQQPPHVQHGQHGQPQQVLHAGNMDHERAHIQEHMQVPIDTSKMSEAELQFHYFKMHDSDNNNKLDGCELIKSLIHWHEQGSKEQHEPNNEHKPHVEEKVFSDEELVALIDPILQMDDTSRDGYIDYPEFIKAQQKAASKQQQEQQQKEGDDEKNPKNSNKNGTGEKDGAVYTDQGLADVIDYVLSTMDYNNDGYVDYAEYRKSEEGQAKDTKTPK